MTNNKLKRKLLKNKDFLTDILSTNKNPLTSAELTAEKKAYYKGQLAQIDEVISHLETNGEKDAITLNIDYDKAEKLSILIFNLFIQNFFDFSQAISDDFISFDDLLKIQHLAIDLKSEIDIALDRIDETEGL